MILDDRSSCANDINQERKFKTAMFQFTIDIVAHCSRGKQELASYSETEDDVEQKGKRTTKKFLPQKRSHFEST